MRFAYNLLLYANLLKPRSHCPLLSLQTLNVHTDSVWCLATPPLTAITHTNYTQPTPNHCLLFHSIVCRR